MRVLEIMPTDWLASLQAVGEKKTISRVRGRPGQPVEDWSCPKVRFDQGQSGKDRPGDLSFSHAGDAFPLFRAEIVDSLRAHANIQEQWLPVEVLDYNDTFQMFNCLDVISAIDPDASELRYYKSTGGLSGVKRYVFDAATIGDRWFFKDTRYASALYCTDNFAQHVIARRWQGFAFRPLWDSEHAPFLSWPSNDEVRDRPEIWGPEGISAGYGVDYSPEEDDE